jgi:hypothetical protein
MKHLTLSNWRKFPRPSTVHQAQEKSWRTCMMPAPLKNARWCATVTFSICPLFPAYEAIKIGWQRGLDRLVVVVEVRQEPARDRQIMPPHCRVIPLVSQIRSELFNSRMMFRLMGRHVNLR